MAGLDGLGEIAGALNLIPGLGTLLSTGTSIASGVIKNKAAQQQQDAANLLAREKAQKPALRPEYTRKLRLDEMAALTGLPNYKQAQQSLEDANAANLRAIRDSSPDGASTVAAISALSGAKNRALNELSGQDALYRANANKVISEDMQTLGDKERDLEVQQHADQALINQQRTNLQNAATANKMNAQDSLLSSVGLLGSQLNKVSDEAKTDLLSGAIKKALTDPKYMDYLKKNGIDPSKIDLSKLLGGSGGLNMGGLNIGGGSNSNLDLGGSIGGGIQLTGNGQ